MRYWDENPIGDEDDFLKNLYNGIKIQKIPEPSSQREYEECTCGICGYRDDCNSRIWYDDDSYPRDSKCYVNPNILYRMKFPLNVVIPTGLTDKDVLCRKCKDWIDFIYKMQNRTGLHQDEMSSYEIERKKSQERHEENVKEITILNEMKEKQLEIIHELRKEIRKLNGSHISPNKEKLKKELIDISDKIKELTPKSNLL